MTFLKESRAEAYWALQCALGRAVKVTGRVDELLTISKEVEAYVELSEEQRNDYVEVGEDGALQLDHLNLTVDSMFAEKMNQAVRDAAYKRTIINSNHAWEPIETRDVQVNAEIA